MYRLHPTPNKSVILRWINRRRHRLIRRLAAIKPTDRVLEIGCESGLLLASLPQVAALVGGDISHTALLDARQRFTNHERSPALVQFDAEELLPFHTNGFDLIICSQVLEHTPEPERVIRQISAIADTNTRVVISVPLEGLRLKLKALLAQLNLLRMLLPGVTPDKCEWHLHSFSRKTLQELCQTAFTIEKVSTLFGDSIVALLRKVER